MSSPEGASPRRRSNSAPTPPHSPSGGRRSSLPTLPAQPLVLSSPPGSPSHSAQDAPSLSPPPPISSVVPSDSVQGALSNAVDLAARTVGARQSASSPLSPPLSPTVSRRASLSQPLLAPTESTSLLPAPRGSVQASDLAPSPPSGPKRVSKSRVAAELLDLGAAVASFPVGSGAVGAVRGAASGATWLGSAAFSGVDNHRERSAVGGAADLFSGVAGAADTVNSVFNYLSSSAHDTFAQVGAWGGYVSNVSWATSGLISTAQAIGNLTTGAQSRAASLLQLSGGLLNTAGAAAGFEATRLTAEDPSDTRATYWGIASAAAWTFGSLATIAGNHLAVRSQNTARQPDLESQ